MEKSKGKTIARYLTAIIGLPLIACGLIFANTLAMDCAVAIVAIISMYEYFNCFKSTGKANPSEWYGYIICILIAFVHFVSKKMLFEVMILLIPVSLLV